MLGYLDAAREWEELAVVERVTAEEKVAKHEPQVSSVFFLFLLRFMFFLFLKYFWWLRWLNLLLFSCCRFCGFCIVNVVAVVVPVCFNVAVVILIRFAVVVVVFISGDFGFFIAALYIVVLLHFFVVLWEVFRP